MMVAKNPHQGTAPKILCVCSAGVLRAPTIANFLATKGFNTRAVGMSEEYALIPLTPILYYWADLIITAMPMREELEARARSWHTNRSVRKTDYPKLIELELDDIYEFNSPLLLAELDSLDLPTKIAEVLNEKQV